MGYLAAPGHARRRDGVDGCGHRDGHGHGGDRGEVGHDRRRVADHGHERDRCERADCERVEEAGLVLHDDDVDARSEMMATITPPSPADDLGDAGSLQVVRRSTVRRAR